MPRIQPIAAPVSPRLASGTNPAAGFGDTPGLSSKTPKVRRDPATPTVDISDLVARREALASQWDGYWRYTGYRVDGARSVASPASPGANVQFTVTSDPAVIAALDMQVPDTDRVVYADGAHGYVIDRLIGDSIESVTSMAPAVDWDIPADSSLPVRVREIQRRFSILRDINDLTNRIAAASRAVVAVTPPTPTLRIVGMPNYGTVEIDGVRTKDDSSRWADAMLSAWIVPVASGSHTVRVSPPTGGGSARTATVTIPATGEAVVTFSAMTPEPDAAPAPTLRIIGMPDRGASFIDGVRTDDARSRWDGTGWVVPASLGSHTIRVVPPTGAARTATVVIPSTGEASVTFSTMTPEAETPHETVPAVTTGTVIFTSRAPFSTVTSAVLRSAPAVTAIPLSRSGDSWTASVPAGRYTLEVIVQPYISSPHPASVPEPPARQSAADVTVVAGQTANVTDADLHATGQTVSHGDASPPPPQSHVVVGTVTVQSSVPNTAAMIQRVAGSQGELGPGIAMTRSAEGTLIANPPLGSYQLVVWQEAEFPSIARTNVRTAPVTVTLGGESRYSYTGTSLTFTGSTGGIARVTSDTSHDAIIMQELQTLAGMHASADVMLLLLSP